MYLYAYIYVSTLLHNTCKYTHIFICMYMHILVCPHICAYTRTTTWLLFLSSCLTCTPDAAGLAVRLRLLPGVLSDFGVVGSEDAASGSDGAATFDELCFVFQGIFPTILFLVSDVLLVSCNMFLDTASLPSRPLDVRLAPIIYM